jgi:polysaccharide biosynthesis/export protein
MFPSNKRNCTLAMVFSICGVFTGCLGMQSNEPPLMQSGPSRMVYYNANGAYSAHLRGVEQVSYSQQAEFGMNPGAAPGEVVMEQPGLGPPMAEGVIVPGNRPLPTEKAVTTHPPHRVSPPDTLFIEALRLIPRGPYRLSPLEIVLLEVTDTLPRQDIKGNFMISPDGNINLGFNYGSVRVADLTIEQAQQTIRNHLSNILKNPTVNIALLQMRTMQNVRGEHLVRPDGTVHLGVYGSVYVAGMTLGQVKCVLEKHLSAYLVDPQLSVDVFAYNSRKIYIIADGAGYGQQVIALPCTGNETVLDAISRVQGLPPVSSQKRIWVARPSPAGYPCSIILPVDWKAIVMAGRTETNYQLFPGDRIFLSADPLITTYNYLDKFLAPIERVLGVTLLGATTYQTLRGTTAGATGVIR